MALDKQLETDSFTEPLFSLVGCLAVWAFAVLSFRFAAHKVMTTMMITGMVLIFLVKLKSFGDFKRFMWTEF